MKVVIAGGRDFLDYSALKRALSSIEFSEEVIIISGAAKGADSLGERYAKENGLKCIRYPAQWGTYGKAAGPIRNQQMCNACDAVICFWDGISPGTRNMISLAKTSKKPLVVFNYDGTLKEYIV